MNHMFASYLSPHLVSSPRRQSQASDNASIATQSTTGSRCSKGSKSSKAMSQDYQVLFTDLQKQQARFQQARSQLASSLLRMGEYHIRNAEYDEAMMALRESLHENRSVICSSLGSMPSLDMSETGDESLVSEMTASQWSGAHTPKGCLSFSSSSSSSYLSAVMSQNKNRSAPTSDPDMVAAQRKSLDDMITTLSNLGKVHSLRKEDAAAMKYYDEKTKIQAIRMSIEEQLSTGSAGCFAGPAGVFFSQGHHNILYEINEDIKALDELFRGMSFRKEVTLTTEKEVKEDDTRNDQDAKECAGDMTEERSAQSSCIDEVSCPTPMSNKSSKRNDESHRRRRTRVSIETSTHESVSVLPPLRQTRRQATSDGGTLKEDNEFADALDMYRTVIDSCGRNTEKYEKKYAEFLRKYEAIQSADSSGDRATKLGPSSNQQLLWRKEWQLALDIYEAALTAQKEATSRTTFPPGTPRKRTASDFSQATGTSIASLLIAMGGLYYKLNNVHMELEKYREALAVYLDTLGRDHPHVAGTMKNIGMVLAEQGYLDEAMDNFQEAQRIYASHSDGPCCDVASALSCMGNVQNRRGELEDALRLYGEALSIYKLVSKSAIEKGGRSRLALQEVALTLKIMGMVYTKRGELDLAMRCFQDAIDIMRQNFNEKGSGPLVTSILSRIGLIFSKMNKLDEAMSHYQEAYDLATRTYGTTDHPEVAQILHYIGSINQRKRNLDEAMRCYKNSAIIFQTTLGRNDPTVATTLVSMGSLHYIAKNLDGAMNYYKEALRLNRSAFGTKHPDVIPTMKSIALIHAKQQNFDNAIEVFTEVLNIVCADVGQIHPEVASSHKRIGNVHYQRGDLTSAECEYRKALSIYLQCLGSDNETTKSVQAIVDKVEKEIADSQTIPNPSTSSSSFFKRAPKGYESL